MIASLYERTRIADLPGRSRPARLGGYTRAPPARPSCTLVELVDLATEIGYRVEISATGPADGSCNSKTRTIKLSEGLEPNGQLAALIHELSHALVAIDPEAPKLDYAQGELVAESVAFACCQTVGLDTAANSIPYLASWAENASLEVLEQTAALTGHLAERIEARLLADAAPSHPVDQELVDAPEPVAA